MSKQTATLKRVTLKDLAQHLKLSPATVSIVLNRSPAADAIPAETQERIFAAARELGYRPNHMARSLRSKKTFFIGVLVPDIRDHYAAGIMSSVEDHLLKAGYFCLAAGHRFQQELLEEYLELLKGRLVEGFVLVASPISAAPGIPTVSVAGHRRLEGVTNVVLDHRRAAALALAHLTKLGHRKIAFFKGHEESADTADRWQAIEEAAQALDVAIEPELTLQLTGASMPDSYSPKRFYQEGYAFGRRLLGRRSEFTCLFAFNDVSAIGAVKAFRDAGLRVPEDVSVMGFDDIQNAAFTNPGLTTIRQPLENMGELAGRILLRRLAGHDAFPDFVTVKPQLVVRASTGPVPSSVPVSA